MDTPTRFIIIDDDVLNNRICTVTLQKIFNDAEINTFLDPEAGFNSVVAEASKAEDDSKVVLFLDLSMPTMDGWEFLDRFGALDEDVKKRVKIYILSSSDNMQDVERATANKYVVHYLVKPFTKKTIRLITLSLGKSNYYVEEQ